MNKSKIIQPEANIGFSYLLAHLDIIGKAIDLILIFFPTSGISYLIKIKNLYLISKSILVGLLLTCIWFFISTVQNSGIYGDLLIYMFLAIGLTTSIRNVVEREGLERCVQIR